IRRAVEGLVAARAAERVSDDDIAMLRDVGRHMQAAVDDGELLRYSELNAALHGKLRDVAGHAVATRMLTQLNGQMVRHQFRLSLRPGRPAQSLPEHLAIIAAVCARSPEAAKAAMEAHVSSVIRTIRHGDDEDSAAAEVARVAL
ncbi:MAG: FCD domain-containing protein, partial [Microbacterium sp.]